MTPQFSLVRLMLQDTGTYNPQVSRPYQAQTGGASLDMLANRIDSVTKNDPTAKINGDLIAGLSSSMQQMGGLIAPVAAWDHELYIPGGWQEPRLRFTLEVELKNPFGVEIYFFQGYTENKDVSYAGNINPDMVFHINSYIKINRSQDHSNMANGGFRDVITESAQVINGQIHASATNSQVFGLRPEDLFTGIQSSYMSQGMGAFSEATYIDDRLDQSTSTLRSRRRNGIPSNFLSTVIGNYRSACTLADMGQGTDDIYGRAVQSSYEGNVYENPFIRALSEFKGMPTHDSVSFFTMNDLAAMDPTINQRTTYNRLMETVRLHHYGDTDNNWMAATLHTQMATILTHAVAGLMTENSLVAVAFHCTNMTLNGQPYTRLMPELCYGVTTADMRGYYNNFVSRFENEVVPDVSMSGVLPFDIVVVADLYGETKIEISLEGGNHEVFVTPSFCDALTSPNVTTKSDDFHNLVTGIETIVNYCGISSTARSPFNESYISNI